MKKLILVLCLFYCVSFANAQSLSFSKKVVNVEGPNATSMDALSTITNISTDLADTAFTWSIVQLSAPTEWLMTFCDPKDCYSDLFTGKNKQFYLKKNASGPLKATFDFGGIKGTGIIAIVVTSVKNPSNSDTVYFNASSWTTGINEVSTQKSLSFYPNPVKDQLTIQFPTKDKVNIEIYNVLGSKVKSFIHDSNNSVIGVGELENGMYFIRIKDKNTTYTKSFTKAD